MQPLQRTQRMLFMFSQLRHASKSAGQASVSANIQNHDGLVKMANPYKAPDKGCVLCNVTVDFKNIQLLSQFISPHTGRIYGRHMTGLCGPKQKAISKAIKKAHAMGFMSVTHKHPQLMRDPNICSIKQPD
uniref:28S ribosomal protein S18c, mitochondrial n=1 Tax=Doryrhamphus excisus TaxID=161450 RepID=UPI0025AE4FDC|nr:28S ribosomal protein S18c, mitochondrial [Doryrhamphus excisus]